MSEKSLELLISLCSTPTAPFAEARVQAYVRAFVAARPKLRLSEDKHGNLLIELGARRAIRARQRWVFTAHMDHPGFIAGKMLDSRTLVARFFGFVKPEYFAHAKVRFFTDAGEIVGTVRNFSFDPQGRSEIPSSVTLNVRQTVPPGTPGMFDLGAGRIKGKLFHSRVCDDLAGAAACLAMLDELSREKRSPDHADVAVLLTRAEEEGFVGCIAACQRPRLLRKTDRIIAIECSKQQPVARQGDGPIIRVGDRTSIFNSALTYFLTSQAKALGETDKAFNYQRALMPGGTCEATVYDVFGFTAASICIALDNYHNMSDGTPKLAAETVNVSDWLNMVRLFVHVANNGHLFAPGFGALVAALKKRFEQMSPLLK